MLIVEEALDSIRAAAIEAGFNERQRLIVESGFNWNQLLVGGQTMSLFSDKHLIELRLPKNGPGKQGAQALVEYADNPAPDTTLVVISAAIDKRAQKSKWFTALDAVGTSVECPQVYPGQLPQWIDERMHSRKLRFDREVVSRLAHYVEGNLLAAAQEIDLLSMLYAGEKISLEQLEASIADHTRFTVFSLVDACLAGSGQRAVRILAGLRRDQIEPTLILWALARDTRTLYHLSKAVSEGQSAHALFQRFGIWQSRSSIVNAALRRIPLSGWQSILRRLARADLMLKGRMLLLRQDIWEEIESITLAICGWRIC